MPLHIIRNDITCMPVDAVVNATDTSLSGAGGVDAAIHRAAGPALAEACAALGGCKTGCAKITPGFALPARYIIHTVGPLWDGETQDAPALLASCYRSALQLAKAHGCASIAFPLIGSGTFGCPKALALQTAIHAIGAFLLEDEMLVYLVVFDTAAYRLSEQLFADIASYIDDRYAAEAACESAAQYSARRPRQARCGNAPLPPSSAPVLRCVENDAQTAPKETAKRKNCTAPSPDVSLDALLARLDESFSEMLLRKIDERGMTDAQCYKKANIDRKLFSKIRSDPLYRPSKATAIAFCLALELPLPEMRQMLEKAGFALSHASKFDLIVEYFVSRGNYSVFEINEALFAFDQSLIGA